MQVITKAFSNKKESNEKVAFKKAKTIIRKAMTYKVPDVHDI